MGEIILLIDEKVIKHKDLAFILAELRQKCYQIFLFKTSQNTHHNYFCDDTYILKGYTFLCLNGGLLFLLNRIFKRVFDLVTTICIFPLFLALFIFIALLIKCESKGPILFKQKRIGKYGKPFTIYKFRTMYENAQEILSAHLESEPVLKEEWELFRKLKKDPRITKVGQILRRFSLDELPQIINIIKGEMSLVGPRPVTKEELDLYYKEYSALYKIVSPGLTGLWQVSGRNNLNYDIRVKLDIYYILNWSFKLDLIILLKTIPAIFTAKGAY